MRKNKHRGIESLKSRYGLMFIAPWFLGFILFFAIPIIQSLLFSLSDVSLNNDGLATKFVGLQHYRYALLQSGAYTQTLGTAVTSLLYQFWRLFSIRNSAEEPFSERFSSCPLL